MEARPGKSRIVGALALAALLAAAAAVVVLSAGEVRAWRRGRALVRELGGEVERPSLPPGGLTLRGSMAEDTERLAAALRACEALARLDAAHLGPHTGATLDALERVAARDGRRWVADLLGRLAGPHPAIAVDALRRPQLAGPAHRALLLAGHAGLACPPESRGRTLGRDPPGQGPLFAVFAWGEPQASDRSYADLILEDGLLRLTGQTSFLVDLGDVALEDAALPGGRHEASPVRRALVPGHTYAGRASDSDLELDVAFRVLDLDAGGAPRISWRILGSRPR